MRRADLLRINLVDVACLGMGFVTSLVVPKLAIGALGIDGYGVVAVLLGVSLIPSFLELGLTPGLTREIGKLHARGQLGSIKRIVLRFQSRLGAAGVVIAIAAAFISAERNVAGAGWQQTFIAVMAGGCANVLTLVAELSLIRVRVAGGFIKASVSRAIYSVIYLSGVILFAIFSSINIESVFIAQLCGACVFLAVAQLLANRLGSADIAAQVSAVLPWRRLSWSVAAEQTGRVQSSLLPGLERHYLLTFGGPTAVSAYDVALRLSALVTAVPGAIAVPLVALFSPNVANAAHDTNRRVLRHMDMLTGIVVVVSGAAVLLLAHNFAITFYGLEGSPLIAFSTLIIVGSAINALTASRVALLYAHDKPIPILIKSVCDLSFTCVAIIAMVVYRDPILFVAAKYLGFIVSTVGLFAFCAVQLPNLERYSEKLT